MGDLNLTLAYEDYDRTRALLDGSVKPEGIDLTYLALPVEEIFWRMPRFEDFDVAEMSMGAFFGCCCTGSASFHCHPRFSFATDSPPTGMVWRPFSPTSWNKA